MTGIRTVPRPTAQVLLGAVLIAGMATAVCADRTTRLRARVQRGEQIAQEQCSACHVVAERQELTPILKQPAPSFRSIANRPQTSDESLRHFVTSTHWDPKTVPPSMPSPELSKSDTMAVIRYILSLKDH